MLCVAFVLMKISSFFPSSVPDDLTPEEQQELENIRRRKQELLEDIQVPELKNNTKIIQSLSTGLLEWSIFIKWVG